MVPAGGPVSLWSGAGRGSLEAAALRNGVATRYLDFNDTYIGRIIVHPSDMIAALVALAEARQAGWPRLIEAVSVAYDILCLMADQSETRKNGFDPATFVPIAVAAGGAWLIGLDPTKTGNALRLAALDAGVLRCIRLGRIADWRAVAAARNAVKGLFAIEMAALGTEGPPGTFEADCGQRCLKPSVASASIAAYAATGRVEAATTGSRTATRSGSDPVCGRFTRSVGSE